MRRTNRSAAKTHVISYFVFVVFVFGQCVACFSQNSGYIRLVPEVKGFFGSIPEKFRKYDVILRPDKDEPEWWAGAPSVVWDQNGVFWLACRMRTTDSPLGLTVPEGLDTDMTVFVPDSDPDTTTDPTNPDADGYGLLDGKEDFNRNGSVDYGESAQTGAMTRFGKPISSFAMRRSTTTRRKSPI